MAKTSEHKLKQGDFVKVETPDDEHLGEYHGRDDDFLIMKGEAEFVYIPRTDVITIRKPFVTIENPTA